MNLFQNISFVILFFITAVSASYAQYKPDWLNPEIFSVNLLPPGSKLIPYTSEQNALTFDHTRTARLKSLNGKWDFKWYKNPKALPADYFDPQFSTGNWDQINVPAYWQMLSISENKPYDKPYFQKSGITPDESFSVIGSDSNATGIYRTTFVVPDDWKNQSVILHFDGVSSACYVWLNGYKLGYHEDSSTPFAFQLDTLLKSGTNQLTVQVLKWNDGTYLENRGGWQLSGIFRDVYLTMHKETHIQDVFVTTDLDDQYKDAILSVSTVIKNNKNYIQYGHKVIATLYDQENKMVDKPVEKVINMLDSTSQMRITNEIRVSNPQKWSAEIPALYKLTIQVADDKGNIFEVTSQKVGFREVNFKSSQFLLNGKAITLKGVNMSVLNPLPATRESMIRDITLMKQHNINAVWLNNGPTAPLWYDLCDEYGLYVINQVNIHTNHAPGINTAPEWNGAFTARAQQVWERDKNHPSIIVWSAGNNIGNGTNLDAVYSYFQLADSTRPVVYRDNESISQRFDLTTANALSENTLTDLPKDNTRPLFLHSFGEADGNGLGNIYQFWQKILKSTARQGGFLDNWSANSIILKNKEGVLSEFRNYESGQFPEGGVVTAEGKPEPEITELKKAFEPVIIVTADTITVQTKGAIITNKFDFKTLNDLELNWSIEENGHRIQQGTMGLDGIRANESREFKFPFDWPASPRPDGNYFLNLSIVTKQDHLWAGKGHEIARKQIPLKIVRIPAVTNVQQSTPLRMNFLRGIGIEITGANFSITFDKETAQMSSYVYKDKEFLESGFNGNFWRVPTHTDQNGDPESLPSLWLSHGIDSLKTVTSDLRVEKLNAHIYKVSMVKRMAARSGSIQINSIYTIYASGDIHIQYAFIPSGTLPPLPRIGLQMQMRENMNELTWFGKGPYETYSDRKESAFTGIYTGKITDQHFPYQPLQETGNKTDVQWFTIKDIENDGLMFIPDTLVNMNVQNYTASDLFRSRQSGKPLPRGNQIVLNIDLEQKGLHFNHEKQTSENRQPMATRRFSFRIKPVDAQTDYFKEANTRLPMIARKMSPGLNKETD